MTTNRTPEPEGPAQEPQRCPCCKSYCSCPCHDAPPAPSQPAARKWFMARRKMDAYISFDDMEEYAQFVTREQTAAKDAEIERLRDGWNHTDAYYRKLHADFKAAERERDSLRAENEALRKDRSETREMVWRLLHNIDEVAAQRDAALKAGKDEQK